MICEQNLNFVIQTKTTTYAFGVMETGQLEHYYYGRKLSFCSIAAGAENRRDTALNEAGAPPKAAAVSEMSALKEKHAFAPGNSINYDSNHPQYSLEDVCLEMSSYGKGDIREPFVTVVHADGSRTSDFLFDHFEIHEKKTELKELPGAYAADGESEELVLYLKDQAYGLLLELRYVVYESCDVITRSAVLCNLSDRAVKIERLMSGQLDLMDSSYVLSTFHGAWAREMQKTDRPLAYGKYVGSSMTGTSSNRTNPFFMLARPEVTQEQGDCFGFNLIYSGNHYEAVEVSSYGKTRVVSGINPEGFSWNLDSGESFETPEMVMTFSAKGYNGLSQRMHQFVRKHIVRGVWKKKVRPVLLNSWEAAYFDINEKKLLELARAGKKAGIELFVMDDGWFGDRKDDARSLGDWDANLKKLPGGLAGICEKINKLGLDFGIWVEPEMVNCDSDLYRGHPDWCMAIPGHPHSEGRNQRMLDLCNVEVQDFLIEKMSEVFGSAPIAYVKWDMNRIMSDVFSPVLEADRQGETAHRYVLGLCRVMKTLTERFPQILFEGCASGGNRFDLGILCYFPQIWGSDNTDAISRAEIQTGYSYGYPPETVGAHVSSCPNHQTLRKTPLETRFAVAAFGSLGYECNFCDMKPEELEEIKAQIRLYKKLRTVMQFGAFYRGRTFSSTTGESGIWGAYGNGFTGISAGIGNICEWTVVSRNQKHAVGMILQKLVQPNTQFQYYRAQGLKRDRIYHVTNRFRKYNIKEFGDLVNTVSPVHIKQDSMAHNLLSKVVKMNGETEEYTVYGDLLMNAGIKLKQGFSGTGYNEEVRFFQDFAARLYFIDEKNI